MGKVIVSIIGSTGAQGGSVVKAFLQDTRYQVRALTRNPESPASKSLAALGVQVVQADVNDPGSLKRAFSGSQVIYGVTNFFEPFGQYGPKKAIEIEVQQGINIADAAAATPTLEHFIWSTLPSSLNISGGKYSVPHFNGKNKIDEYIKANKILYSKTTFLWVTFYAQNFLLPFWKPFAVPTAEPGKYIQFQPTSPSTPIRSIGDVATNVGIFVHAIVVQPTKTCGKYVLAEVETLTAGEYLQTWAKAQKKEATYVQIDRDTFYGMWPVWAEEMGTMSIFWEEYRELSWSGEKDILTKEDLGISGLFTTAEAFANMTDWN